MADVDPAPVRKRRAKRSTRTDTSDPVEIAMASVATGTDRAAPARVVLEKHAQLIDIQCRREREQWRVLRLQRLLRWLLLLAVAAVLIGLGAMVIDAWRSRGIVIESFSVPPSFEAEGLSGEVVAAKILDRLTDMRARTTGTSRAGDELESGWRDDYRVAIPQTGISIGEVRTALRRWLGDDTLISGGLHRTSRGIVLTVRSNRGASATFEGAAGELDALTLRAAEDIYRKTMPYLFSIFLAQNNRLDEAIALRRQLAESDTDAAERAWALSGLGMAYYSLGRCAEAIPVLERAIRLNPTLPNAFNNLGIAHECLGKQQVGYDYRARAIDLVHGGRASGQDPARRRQAWWGTEADLAGILGDFRHQLQLIERMEANGESNLLWRASSLAFMRDVRGSMRLLAQFRPEQWAEGDRLNYWFSRYAQARALGDWRAAALFVSRSLQACETSRRRGQEICPTELTVARPFVAEALLRAGDRAAAAAMLRPLPRDCHYCAWARALLAEAGGDRAGADRWFAQAVRLGPRLPFAYFEWGKARLSRRDAPGALAMFDEALRYGPENPDAHKGRADALLMLGRRDDALRSHAAAAERAPRWGALHINWGISLWRIGRREEAREKWRAAAGMDLSRNDRARLERIIARTGSG